MFLKHVVNANDSITACFVSSSCTAWSLLTGSVKRIPLLSPYCVVIVGTKRRDEY